MANDYLKDKWRMWLKDFDLNHDRETNLLDMDYDWKAFVKLGHVPQEKQPLAKKNLETWWRKYLFFGQSGISEDQFLNCMNSAFAKNPEQFKQRMKECFEMIFDIAEEGKEALTEDEFVTVFKAAGHRNVGLDRKFFQAYGPLNGKVPIKTLVDSWIVFITCADSAVPDIVLQAYKAGF